MPSGGARCCITSPPYWGLRDYGVPGQIGAEPTLEAYLKELVATFSAVRRVLTDDGTLWLNIGDAYTSGQHSPRYRGADANPHREMRYRAPTPKGLKAKDLMGIPWRLAFALQSDGWYLRSEIIWHKTNCQPESVKDRPTRAHEYVFLLSKSPRYFYNAAAVRSESGANARSVWPISINASRSRGDHPAMFPPDLPRRCMLAGSAKGDLVLDPFAGSGEAGCVAKTLGRRFVGIELNPAYAASAEQRIRQHGEVR